MANLIIAYPDRVTDSTFAGGDWEASLPLSNLKSLPLGLVARSTDADKDHTKFTFDVPAYCSLRVLALCAHNLSFDAQYRIRADFYREMLDPIYDSGWLDVWHEDWKEETFVDEGYNLLPDERATYPSTLVHVLSSPVLRQFWEISFDDEDNEDGYVQIGRLYAAPGWELGVNYDMGSSFVWETATQVEMTLGGQQYFDRQAHQRVFRCGLSWLSELEADARLWELQRAMGIDQELVVVPEPGDPKRMVRRAFLARMRSLNPVEHPLALYYQTALEFIEVL